MRRRRRNKNTLKGDFFGAVFVFFLFILYTQPKFIETLLIVFGTILFLSVLFYLLYIAIRKQSNLTLQANETLPKKSNKKNSKFSKLAANHYIEEDKRPDQQTKQKNRLSECKNHLAKVKTSGVSETEKNWSLNLICSLEWKRFEELCREYFTSKGYKAELTKKGADGGIDVMIFKESYSLLKPFGIIQCKAWGKSRIGVKLIRELYGVMASEKTPLGVFMTTGEFTSDAMKFSKNKHLKLISGVQFLKLIRELPDKAQISVFKTCYKGRLFNAHMSIM
jgi:restriction endonuclease Mrr